MTKRPAPDQQYFGKKDTWRKRKLAEEKRLKIAQDELERLKTLHWRRCASCGLELEEISFKGTSVHKCFNCGAVFMENGVLEKLCGEEGNFLESLLDLFKF